MLLRDNIHYKTAAVLFGGIGGESAGLLRSQVEYGGGLYRFKLLCSIDSDPVACRNHDLITGEQTSVVMDLFRRWQYKAWHKQEPPANWREMTAWDIWLAFKQQVPFFLFSSPPCKGLSGLLPKEKSESEQYQALNFLTVSGLELALQACDEYGDAIPAIIQLENVPRITSRGKPLLKQIKKLLKKFGYEVSIRADHNLGEIGGLGQNRVRFLIMARDPKQVPNVIYYPAPKPMRTIGDVIGPLPTPGIRRWADRCTSYRAFNGRPGCGSHLFPPAAIGGIYRRWIIRACGLFMSLVLAPTVWPSGINHPER
ncbi:DNA cytosine methyltransferase [Cohnella cellulosilytica]|uniref:DNA cytosine methyltransferase n=1 Tax=Cohnella cellulosilytica TaxID=986710 RepID=UPI003610D6F6